MADDKNPTTRVSRAVKKQLKDLKAALGVSSVNAVDQAFKIYNDSETGIKDNEWREKHTPINQESKDDVEKKMERSPVWVKVSSTHPPNRFIDACILSLYAPSEYENFEEHSPPNPEGEDFLVIYYRSRERIIEEVQYHIKKGLNGTSWAEVFKGWANEKGTDTKLVDNRIKSLREQGFITNETPDEDVDQYRGQYRLIKVITEDQWKFIEGVLNLPPQKGISLPKIL